MKTLRQFFLFMGFILFVVTFTSSCQKQLTTNNETIPNHKTTSQYIEYGKTAFQRGEFAHAAYYWNEALSSLSVQNDSEKYIDTSLHLAIANLKLGQFKEVFRLLESALSNLEQIDEPKRHIYQAKIFMYSSDAHLALRNVQKENLNCGMQSKTNEELISLLRDNTQIFTPKKIIGIAEELLKESEKLLEEVDPNKVNHPLLWANLLNKKINIQLLNIFELLKEDKQLVVHKIEKSYDEIVSTYYQKIFSIPQETLQEDIRILNAKNALNIFQGAVRLGYFEEIVKPEIEITKRKLLKLLKNLPLSYDKTFALISLAHLIQHYVIEKPKASQKFSPSIYEYVKEALNKASDVAIKQQNQVAIAYANLYLTRFYEDQNYQEILEKDAVDSNNEAIQLIQEALRHVQNYPFDSSKNREYNNSISNLLTVKVNVYVPSTLEKDRSETECRQLCQDDFLSSFFEKCKEKGRCQQVPSPFFQNYYHKVAFQASPLSLQNYHPELLFQLEWQLAKLRQKDQEVPSNFDPQITDSINALYERAEKYLQQVRQGQQSFSESFRDDMENFYKDWDDFLLRQASNADAPNQAQLLEKAIEVIESYKATEIQNFFKDECITESTTGRLADITKMKQFLVSHSDTVFFYPIVFEDRTELLLISAQGIQQLKPSTMSRVSLTSKIDEFERYIKRIEIAHNLRKKTRQASQREIYTDTSYAILQNAYGESKSILQEFYRELISPILEEEILERQQIKTIIVVPDDSLRKIPFAALHSADDQPYLIQDYAVVVAQGIKLIDLNKPRPFKKLQFLLAGSDFKNLDSEQKTSLKGTSFNSNDPNIEEEIPCVPLELKQISCVIKDDCVDSNQWKSQLEKNCRLSDKERRHLEAQVETRGVVFRDKFVLETLKERFKHTSYSAIHLSTHGSFGNTLENIYLRDGKFGKISMVQLKELLQVTQLKKQSIDLLTFSACETAKGDKRAALGLAGVTLSAGSRSTLATLWKVIDSVSTELMVMFYQNLKDNPDWSKAKALQEAQKKLIDKTGWVQIEENGKIIGHKPERVYNHPYFWAPFLLIGNWL
jgi:CHAT domain-containing protein